MVTANTAKFSVSVDAQLKSEAEKCLEDVGMTMSTAINVYLHQIVRHRGIPFIISSAPIPKQELLDAMEEGERIANDPNAKGYHDMDSLFEALNS